MFNWGFRCLSKFAFQCSVIQQRETVVLESMSFEALSWECFRTGITSYREDYLVYYATNKVVKNMYADALA